MSSVLVQDSIEAARNPDAHPVELTDPISSKRQSARQYQTLMD